MRAQQPQLNWLVHSRHTGNNDPQPYEKNKIRHRWIRAAHCPASEKPKKYEKKAEMRAYYDQLLKSNQNT
jgi:hypothetical protein